MRRRAFVLLVVGTAGVAGVWALDCRRPSPVPPPDLRGTWVADPSRVDDLRVVSHAVKGPDRERARARALRDMEGMEVVFGDHEATLRTRSATRTVPYRVVGAQGPLVVLEGLHGDEKVSTRMRVDGDRLTWFDADGEIELVLRRVSDRDRV